MEKLHELNQIFAGNDENIENGAVASARAKFTVSDPDLTLAQVNCLAFVCQFKSSVSDKSANFVDQILEF